MSDDHEDLTSLTESAISQHEMYLSWIAAGFTPEQALDLLKTVLAQVMGGNS